MALGARLTLRLRFRKVQNKKRICRRRLRQSQNTPPIFFFNHTGGFQMTRTLEQLKEQVSLVEYVQGQGYDLKRAGAGTYRINPCPICGRQDHFTINENGNYFNSFSSCCTGGSIIDWFMQIEGMEQNDAIDKLYSLAGEERQTRGDGYTQGKESVSLTNEKKTPSQPQLDAQPQPNNELDFTDYITKAHKEALEKYQAEMRQFSVERGLTASELVKYKIGIGYQSPTNKRLAVILPIFSKGKVVCYDARMLEGELRYLKSSSNVLFNADYLDETPDQPIFLTEGIIDAISLERLGYKAISINSAKNKEQFIQEFKNREHLKPHHFLTVMDNDDEGRNATNYFKEFGFSSIDIPEQFEDVNEWFVYDLKNAQEALQDASEDLGTLGIKQAIERQIEALKQPDNLETYLDLFLDDEIAKLKSYADKKTGFPNLDKKMNGLNAGLYVVGGVSSVGKTTFVHQLADQLAEQGDHVIYFSLEQSKLEMVTKSLARETANVDYSKALTSLKVRRGFKTAELKQALTNYKKYARNVNVVEGNFDTNVMTMKSYIERYMQENGVSPIVFIDYLQIMPAIDPRMNDKQKTDTNVTELKRLSRDLAIPVFVISSFNRASYTVGASMESFKESGGIEYTADVVWALQYAVVESQKFKDTEKQAEKNEMAEKAKRETVREIQLKCLKNRYGGDYDCKFSYHSSFDLYRPNEGLNGFSTTGHISSGEGAGGLAQIVKEKKTF